MSQQKLNSRQRSERWTQAVELAKKGQYSKVRFILADMHDEPKVRKLLEKIEGRNDKLQGGITRFFNITLVVIVVVGIALLAIAWNFTQSFQAETVNRAELNAEFEARGLEGSRPLFEDLLTICLDGTNDSAMPCVDWAEDVFTNYSDTLPACTLLNEDGGIDYRGQERDQLADCLINQGVPPLPPSA